MAAGNHFATAIKGLEIVQGLKGKVTRASSADVVARIVEGKANDMGGRVVTLLVADKRLKLKECLAVNLRATQNMLAAMLMVNAR